MPSGVMITKSSPVVVVPSESVPAPLLTGETVGLSSFDKCVAPFPVTMMIAFDRPIPEPADTIKRALSRVLGHYRPITGRLTAGPGDGEFCIACTDEGLTFVGASASCALEDVTTAQLMDLAIRYLGDFCRDTDPLLLVQVTEFSCGGFVVGVTFNHIIADGAGMVQFLSSVGEFARGVSPPSVVPVQHWDDRLPGLPASMVAPQKSTMTHGRKALTRADIIIPFSLINRIKGEFGGTVFEIVAAVLWRGAALARSCPRTIPNPLRLSPSRATYAGTSAPGLATMATALSCSWYRQRAVPWPAVASVTWWR
ncbi:hypothetical protein BS78_03G246000 [Paspalum vaginatum]|nr:hypothetical protein BS78_03G246000 [Paspalum vaginatum]